MLLAYPKDHVFCNSYCLIVEYTIMTSPENEKPIIPDRWLLGDDLDFMRDSFEELLSSYGIAVKTVGDPDELLEEYKRSQRSYDFVLTDFNYNKGFEKTGLYVARQLRQITEAPIPVALYSGNEFNVAQKTELSAVIDLIWRKPVRVAVMFSEIKKSAGVQALLAARREFYSSR